MEYRDFAIQIHKIEAKRTWVRMASPHGEASQERVIPDSIDTFGNSTDLETVIRDGEEPRDLRPVVEEAGACQEKARDLKQTGNELFRFLFFPEALSLWDRCWNEITGHGDRGIRIKLQLDLKKSGVLRLASLPWELLYHEPSGGFLALDGRTPVARYLDLPTPVRPLPNERPWRILVVAPDPTDVQPIDRETELAELLSIWGRDEAIEPIILSRATIGEIRQAIARRHIRIHAIHFLGHGIYDPATGQGGLVLEGKNGRAENLLGPQLANLLKGIEVPSVAILNGCRTGQISGVGTPFAGVATALAQAGVPAVVAMRRPIQDRVAIQFSKHLFAALHEGHPLDWATSEARLHLSFEYPDSFVWAIPTLFTRMSDCKIVREEVEQPRKNGPLPPIVGTRYLRTGDLNIYHSESESSQELLQALDAISADKVNVGLSSDDYH